MLKWAAIIWYSAGAMASLCWLVQAEGQTLFLGRFDEKALSTLAAVVIALLGLLVLRAGPAGQQKIALLFFMFCLGVVLLCFVTQIGGLWIRTKGYEQYLGDNFSVFQRMLLAGAPATIFAIRLGRANPSRRAIVWTGLCGLWLPMVCSVSLVSVAAMCGARLYWQNSGRIGAAFAFVWIARTLLKDLRSVFLLMTFIPMVTPALWIEYLTEELGWTWKRWVVLLVIGAFGFDLLKMAEDDVSLLQGYYLPWCWSILCGVPLLTVCFVAGRTWQRFHQAGSSPPPPPC